MTLIVDDAQLLRMAAEPPRDAAPGLSRALSYEPIVWLLAVVPPLVLLVRSGLDGDSAAWAIRSLSVVQADRLHEWLIPGTAFGDQWLAWLPPLQSWLTALFVGWGPPGAIAPTLAVSAASSMATVLLLHAWVREAVGPRAAFLAAVMLGLHPQFLLMASSGRPEALTTALLTTLGWGLWSHWHGTRGLASVRLLCAGVAWGLAVLAGGPVAVAAWLALVLFWFWEGGRSLTGVAQGEPSSALQLGRGLVMLLITGGALSLWWIAMLLAEGGLAFLEVWLHLDGPPAAVVPAADGAKWLGVQAWLCRSAFLAGWWAIGFRQAVRWRQPEEGSPARRLGRWMACWFVVGALLRLMPVLLPGLEMTATRPWEAWLVIPTVVLAAQGLDTVLHRDVANRAFITALTITVGMVVWALTGRLMIGLIVAGTFALLIFASAPLAVGLRRTSLAWTETGIRHWMQVAALITLCGPLGLDWLLLSPRDADRLRYLELRTRLAQIPDVHLMSVIGDGDSPPPPLVFLLRSLWPNARLSVTNGWDPLLTEAIVAEANQPQSRLLIVEWSRKELRVRADVGNVWQVSQVVDPVAYGQRRLAVQMIAPAAPR